MCITHKKNKNFLSWRDIMVNTQIYLVEDPLISIDLTKEEFDEIYKEILDTLIGDSNSYKTCIEYYFIVNPLRNDTLKFIDSNKKTEFYEIGINNKTHCDINNIHNGTYEIDI